MRLLWLPSVALVLGLAYRAGANEPQPAPSAPVKVIRVNLDLADEPKSNPTPQPTDLPLLPIPVEVPEQPADKPPVEESPRPQEDEKPRLPTIPEILGDQSPINALITLRPGLSPKPGFTQILVPSPRYFKIADNDSPEPRSRSYVSFNYFNEYGDEINRRLGTGILRTRIHREIFGWEWASADKNSSFGIRVPLATYNAVHEIQGLNGNHTTFGDLALIFKEVVWRDEEAGHLISGGLAIVTPTGPSSFAGVERIRGYHDTVLQPFVGSIWRFGSFYVQGFTAVDAPCNLNDVVVLNNDLAFGYFLFQNHRADSGLSAVVPTFEVHVNTPLNHRGILSLDDKAGTPDMVHLAGGVHFEYANQHSLGVGFVAPVTGPRMFDFEIAAQLRWRY